MMIVLTVMQYSIIDENIFIDKPNDNEEDDDIVLREVICVAIILFPINA